MIERQSHEAKEQSSELAEEKRQTWKDVLLAMARGLSFPSPSDVTEKLAKKLEAGENPHLKHQGATPGCSHCKSWILNRMFSQAHPLGDIWVFGFKFLKSAQDPDRSVPAAGSSATDLRQGDERYNQAHPCAQSNDSAL